MASINRKERKERSLEEEESESILKNKNLSSLTGEHIILTL
jgi:hypothetical protein